MLGAVGFVMQQAPDLRTALRKLSQPFGHHNQEARTSGTVQRQLKEPGTSDQQPLKAVRFDIARRYLLQSSGWLATLADALRHTPLSVFSSVHADGGMVFHLGLGESHSCGASVPGAFSGGANRAGTICPVPTQ